MMSCRTQFYLPYTLLCIISNDEKLHYLLCIVFMCMRHTLGALAPENLDLIFAPFHLISEFVSSKKNLQKYFM